MHVAVPQPNQPSEQCDSRLTQVMQQNYLRNNKYDLKPQSHDIPYFPDHKAHFILPLKHNIKYCFS